MAHTRKKKIIEAWDNADEILQDLALSDEEIVEIIPDIRQRTKVIAENLQEMFTNEEYNEVYPDPNIPKVKK